MNYERELVHYHLCELNFELVLFKYELAQHCMAVIPELLVGPDTTMEAILKIDCLP